MAQCRSCEVPIVFVRMADTGKAMPCNPGPDERANIACRRKGFGYVDGRVITNLDQLRDGETALLAHWATCGGTTASRTKSTTPKPTPTAEPRLF